MTKTAVNLLWTGGLDSTFRLLEALLIEKRVVKPYYMLDTARFSLRNEIKAMSKIKNLLFEKHPFTKELLMPIEYVDVDDIKTDQTIQKAFKELSSIRHLGIQYRWLAEFCVEHGIKDLELGIIRKGEASDHGEALSESLDPFIEPIDSDEKVYKINTEKTKADGSQKAMLYEKVFENYHLPIITYSKKDMVEMAKKNGWMDFVGLTWYCHRPRKFKYPCGKCNPCKTAKQEGVAKKTPLIRWKYFYKEKYS